MEEETRRPGEDDPEGRDGEASEGDEAREGRPAVVNVIRQNAVIITGWEKKGGSDKTDESKSEG